MTKRRGRRSSKAEDAERNSPNCLRLTQPPLQQIDAKITLKRVFREVLERGGGTKDVIRDPPSPRLWRDESVISDAQAD